MQKAMLRKMVMQMRFFGFRGCSVAVVGLDAMATQRFSLDLCHRLTCRIGAASHHDNLTLEER
jgi:hypothetical protein